MTDYPMIQLCRALLQQEMRVIDERMAYQSAEYDRAEQAKSEAKELLRKAALTIQIERDVCAPGDMWHVRVMFEPRRFYASAMMRGGGLSNLDYEAHNIAKQVAHLTRKGLLEIFSGKESRP